MNQRKTDSHPDIFAIQLPAVYRFVGASFAASPSQLGYLTLSRALVQALASPLGGLLGELLAV